MANLTAAELAATLAHETGHIRAADNLKRLLLQALPGTFWLRPLRTEWARACELAADDAAVESGVSALDLASALVKAGRMQLHSCDIGPALASHFVPPGTESQLGERVRHLEQLLHGQAHPSRGRSWRLWWVGAGAALALYAVYFVPLMHTAHEAIERLVR